MFVSIFYSIRKLNNTKSHNFANSTSVASVKWELWLLKLISSQKCLALTKNVNNRECMKSQSDRAITFWVWPHFFCPQKWLLKFLQSVLASLVTTRISSVEAVEKTKRGDWPSDQDFSLFTNLCREIQGVELEFQFATLQTFVWFEIFLHLYSASTLSIQRFQDTMLQKFSKCEVKAELCGNFAIFLPLRFSV